MLAIDAGAKRLESYPELGVSMDDETGRREQRESIARDDVLDNNPANPADAA